MATEHSSVDHRALAPHCGTCGADWNEEVVFCVVCESGFVCHADTIESVGTAIACIGSIRRAANEAKLERHNVFDDPA